VHSRLCGKGWGSKRRGVPEPKEGCDTDTPVEEQTEWVQRECG